MAPCMVSSSENGWSDTPDGTFTLLNINCSKSDSDAFTALTLAGFKVPIAIFIIFFLLYIKKSARLAQGMTDKNPADFFVRFYSGRRERFRLSSMRKILYFLIS
jgi:hypothetical protein